MWVGLVDMGPQEFKGCVVVSSHGCVLATVGDGTTYQWWILGCHDPRVGLDWELDRELSWELDRGLAFLRVLRGRLCLGKLLIYEGHVGLLWSGFSLGLTSSVAG